MRELISQCNFLKDCLKMAIPVSSLTLDTQKQYVTLISKHARGKKHMARKKVSDERNKLLGNSKAA